MNKLISVIIPTYNRPQLLKRAINSVKNQTYNNIEIIIVDGSNNNDTKLLFKNDEQCIYIKSTHNHPNVLRNIGINNCNGQLIAFLDDDDTWEKTKTIKQLNNFKNNPIGLCYTGKNIINKNNEKIKYSYKKPKFSSAVLSIMWDNFIGTTSSIMVDKKVFKEINLLDEKLPALQDYDLCIQICEKFKVSGIDEPLINYYYNHTPNQISEKKENFNLASKIIREKYSYLPYNFLLSFGLWQQKIKRKIKNRYE